MSCKSILDSRKREKQNMYERLLSSLEPAFYSFMRLFFGLLFMQHGAQKLFGALEGQQAPLFSLMGLAGVIEFFGGLLIAIGLLTRPAAFIAAGEMAAAYLMAHAPQSVWPILNQGELALLFMVGFLYILVRGGGRWSLDPLIFAERGTRAERPPGGIRRDPGPRH
jgi:putative oxidoreductase